MKTLTRPSGAILCGILLCCAGAAPRAQADEAECPTVTSGAALEATPGAIQIVGQTVNGLMTAGDGSTVHAGVVPCYVTLRGGGENANLTSTVPADQGSLWRSANNTIRLAFDVDITTPAAGELEIRSLVTGGGYGADLSGSFLLTVETDGSGHPRVLRIREATPVLAHGTWYAVLNRSHWPGVNEFTVQYVVEVGDVDNNGMVLNNDVGYINLIIPAFGVPDDDRRDIDGDGFVLNNDVSYVNLHIPSFKPPKPSGH